MLLVSSMIFCTGGILASREKKISSFHEIYLDPFYFHRLLADITLYDLKRNNWFLLYFINLNSSSPILFNISIAKSDIEDLLLSKLSLEVSIESLSSVEDSGIQTIIANVSLKTPISPKLKHHIYNLPSSSSTFMIQGKAFKLAEVAYKNKTYTRRSQNNMVMKRYLVFFTL